MTRRYIFVPSRGATNEERDEALALMEEQLKTLQESQTMLREGINRMLAELQIINTQLSASSGYDAQDLRDDAYLGDEPCL